MINCPSFRNSRYADQVLTYSGIGIPVDERPWFRYESRDDLNPLLNY